MEYYDEIAVSYNELHGQEQLNKARIIAQNLNISEKDHILDIGAGTGIYDDLFKCQKTNLDPSKQLLKQSKTNAVIGIAESLPFETKTFTIIISISALHHVKEINKTIDEMKRVATDKAQFAFSLLKKSNNFDNWLREIRNNFSVRKETDEDKDLILII